MLLEVEHLIKQYYCGMSRRNIVTSVNDVSFNMKQGELLGLMGHSGSGKTTVAKMIAQLIMPTSGRIIFSGKNIFQSSRRSIIERRRELQIIFQNPKLALNPNYNIRQQIIEPIKLFSLAGNRQEIHDLVLSSMDSVGLSREIMHRYPNEISGGQAQRVAIARSLCLHPRLLISDEATSMLDLSVQAQIIELFKEIHDKYDISILMISHDRNVVEHFCDRVIVMNKGRINSIYNSKVSKSIKVFDSFVKAIELPKIIRLENNFYCVSFSLMKLLPAKFIINRAVERGLINKETVIIESSSGTFALGLALVCNALKYKFIIVSDPVMDDNLIRRIEDLGGTVKIVQKPNIIGGFQGSRLEQVDILRKLYRNNFWTNQYDNPDNPLSYAKVAEQIQNSIGNIDAIVGSVGSGGSMCGITTHLRKRGFVYAIGVDTNGSVLFGQNDQKRILRGLGNSIFPKNLDHTVFNEVHWIEANQAYLETRNLHREYSLFCGGTSGAAYSIANWYRKLHPSKIVLAILPDEGYRYQETIYNNSWLEKEGLDKNDFLDGPKLVNIPKEATTGWFRILWDCRRYDEVIK